MIHEDYKKILNGIIDSNLTQIQNLDMVEGIEGGPIDDKTRRKLETMYKSIRETLNLDLPMRAGEVLTLGIGANLSLTSIKTSLERAQKTIDWYNKVLMPAFEDIQNQTGNDEIVNTFYKYFSEPIDEKISD